MSQSVPAFYINLDSRTDRREYFEDQLQRAGIAAERVTAVTPADIAPGVIAASTLSPTELACSFSHRKIWQIMRDRGLTAALIMEDDGVLSALIAQVLGTPDLAHRVDALQLESHPSNALVGPPLPASSGVTINRLMSSSLGTCAYYITERFARQIAGHPLVDQLAVDKLLFGRNGALIYRAAIYQSVPALAVPLESFATAQISAARSDLQAERISSVGGRRRSLRDRFTKMTRNAGYALRVIGAFTTTGELFGARQVKLPVADDITSQLKSI